MHWVFLNQYYPPDVAPTGVVLQDLARELVRRGDEVTVVCGPGGYGTGGVAGRAPAAEGPGEAGRGAHPGDGVRVERVQGTRFGRGTFLGKLADYGLFYIGVGWRLLRLHPRPGHVVALTTPPYLSVLARVVSKLRGAEHGHWVMDMYPDVMAAHGMLREGGASFRVLRRLAAWGWGGARCTVVLGLGPAMAERLAGVTGRPGKVAWVPLWGTGREVGGEAAGERAAALRDARGWDADKVVVMYSGNMGLGHLFDEICEVMGTATPADGLWFAFYGDGKRRGELERFLRGHPEAPMELHGYVDGTDLSAHLRSGDVHVVSLSPKWTGMMVPSKLQGVFAAGRPVIFIGDSKSDVARWVRESGAGWVVEAGDVGGLRRALDEARQPGVRDERGRAARCYAERSFARETNVGSVIAAFRGEG